MIKIPYEDILEKIQKQSELTIDEIEEKIKAKLDQLKGLISKEGAAHIIANELGVKVHEEITGPVKIEKILPGMRGIDIIAKVQVKYEKREFKRGESTGKVASMMVADETGRTRVVMWGSKADQIDTLNAEDVIVIKNVYVRENNNYKEVHLNDQSELDVNPEGVTVEVPEYTGPTGSGERKKIVELTEADQNVSLLGTILSAYDIRFYEVCPECGKRMKNEDGHYACPSHGVVDPDYAYLINVLLDDGTESIRVVCFRKQVENLLGLDQEQIKQFRSAPEAFEDLKSKLMGTIVEFTGRASNNLMFDRLEFVAQLVNVNPDPEAELKILDEEASEETVE